MLQFKPSSQSAKATLADQALQDLKGSGLPTGLRVLAFPTGTAIPVEVAARAVMDTMYRPSVSVTERKEGTINWTPASTGYQTVQIGEHTVSLKPGLIYSKLAIEVSGDLAPMVAQAKQEAADRIAKAKASAQTKGGTTNK